MRVTFSIADDLVDSIEREAAAHGLSVSEFTAVLYAAWLEVMQHANSPHAAPGEPDHPADRAMQALAVRDTALRRLREISASRTTSPE